MFVKASLPKLLPHFCYIFNYIIRTSEFPASWKKAKIIPIPKSSNEYRPIAILPFLSKVFESILQVQINKFLTKFNLINVYQSGFRAGHSCVSALINVVEDIRCEMDVNKISILSLLDHSKAFDSINHTILCYKLKHFYKFSTSAVS